MSTKELIRVRTGYLPSRPESCFIYQFLWTLISPNLNSQALIEKKKKEHSLPERPKPSSRAEIKLNILTVNQKCLNLTRAEFDSILNYLVSF